MHVLNMYFVRIYVLDNNYQINYDLDFLKKKSEIPPAVV